MLILFWGSLLGIFYAYIGYPMLLWGIALFCNHTVQRDSSYTPSVTLIITVHNEAKRIEKKINNTLALDYPKDMLEIIFASDCSTDETHTIVERYADKGIRLIVSPHRGGKEHAQKCAIAESAGEIIVFTDVATMLEPDGLRKIVSNFADSSVGCVSSEDRFIDEDGTVSGEGAYVKYEMWLRSLEARVYSVVGLSGSFFAARKVICQDWPTNIPSDFNTLLNTIRAGYRGISDPQSLGIYTNIKDQSREFERKVRTITRGISALMANRQLLNPFKFGLFSWQLASHKLMRWLVPWLLALAFVANTILALKSIYYRLLLVAHVLLYSLTLGGSSLAEKSILFKIPIYFIQVNRAIVVSWTKYIRGERFVTWTPSTR